MISKLIDYPGPLWKLYSALALLFLAFSVAAWGTFIFVTSPITNRSFRTWQIGSWNRFALRIFRTKVRAKVDPSYDPKAPCLLVCNHQSYLDIPVVFHTLRGDVRMVAKKELFRIPIFGQCMTLCEMIPIERGNREAGRKAAARISARIRSGLQIWVAPEGTRTDDGKLQAFKSGSMGVAIDAGVPIQPIVVINAYDVYNKHQILFKPGMTIDFEVLPQISTEGKRLEDRHEFAERTHSVILAALEARSVSTK